MDYHFYAAKESAPEPRRVNIRRIATYFLPVFVLAGLLPALLGLVKNPVTTRFTTQASLNQLTLWLTPANVEASVGTPVTLTVMGHFESNDLLPQVFVPLQVSGQGTLDKESVLFTKPFSGQVEMATITVTPQAAGELVVSINKDAVDTKFIDFRPEVLVSPATIFVSN